MEAAVFGGVFRRLAWVRMRARCSGWFWRGLREVRRAARCATG